jgi:hypothetical protein
MEELVTCDTILNWFKEQTENRRPISPHLYLEMAQKLNALSSDENDKLVDLESELARHRADWVSVGKTSAGANILVEAMPVFNEARKQRAKIKQIEEVIRLAKLSARIKNDEMLRS